MEQKMYSNVKEIGFMTKYETITKDYLFAILISRTEEEKIFLLHGK